MQIKLPKELLDSLPSPDSNGLVRVMAAVRVDPEGNATVVRLGDTPVDTTSDREGEGDGEEPAGDELGNYSPPDLDAMEADIYG